MQNICNGTMENKNCTNLSRHLVTNMNISHDFPTIDYIYDCTVANPVNILPVDQRFYCPDNLDIKNKGVDIYSAAVSKMI